MVILNDNSVILSIIKNIDYENKKIDDFLLSIPKNKKDRALKYSYNDCINSIIGYKLLEKEAKEHWGMDKLPPFGYTFYGKPYLKKKATDNFFFNISHTNGCVAVALASSPIGVDVECIKNMDLNIGEMFLNVKEKKQIIDDIDEENTMSEETRIWTLKESYLKRTGIGLIDNLMEVDTTKFRTNATSFKFDEYWVSINSSISDVHLQISVIEDKNLKNKNGI